MNEAVGEGAPKDSGLGATSIAPGPMWQYALFLAGGVLVTGAIVLGTYLVARIGIRSGSEWLACAAVIPTIVYIYWFFLTTFWTPLSVDLPQRGVAESHTEPKQLAHSLPHYRAEFEFNAATDADPVHRISTAMFVTGRLIKALLVLASARLIAMDGLSLSESAWVQAWVTMPCSEYVLALLLFSPIARLLPLSGLVARLTPANRLHELRSATSSLAESSMIFVPGMTVLFSVWTAFYFERNWVTSSTILNNTEPLTASERFYTWHLLDSVPTFKIPETLHWTLEPSFNDSLSGAFLLAYKAIVILPLVALALMLLRAWFDTSSLQREGDNEPSPPLV